MVFLPRVFLCILSLLPEGVSKADSAPDGP